MRTIYGLSSYGSEPVEPISMFAHVLNLPESEDIWPGEWVSQFPHFTVTRHVDGTEVYQRSSEVDKHMRYEWLRIGWAHIPEGSHDRTYTQHLAFHRYVLQEFSVNQDNLASYIADCDDCDDGFAEFLDDAVILAPEKAKETPLVTYGPPDWFPKERLIALDKENILCLNHPGFVSSQRAASLIEWEDL